MGVQIGYDPEIFNVYGTLLELAEYFEARKGSLKPLAEWMDREWHKQLDRVDSSRVHQAIMNLDSPIIYTTNYDRWLEIAHERRKKRFVKVANVADFTKIRDDATQIVKLHGDLDDPESLVLTETSYFRRLSFESPLDLRLRADSIGRALLFLGYSLSDINIRYLLYKLQRLWAESSFADGRPKSFIFLAQPNRVQEQILMKRGIHPIISTIEDPQEGLEDFLEELLKASSTPH
jgi:hypothetical protein